MLFTSAAKVSLVSKQFLFYFEAQQEKVKGMLDDAKNKAFNKVFTSIKLPMNIEIKA